MYGFYYSLIFPSFEALLGLFSFKTLMAPYHDVTNIPCFLIIAMTMFEYVYF